MTLYRIEDLALSLSLNSSIDFHPLQHAVHNVQVASIKLDDEKAAAEEDFKEKLSKLPKLGSPPHSRVLFSLRRLVYHIFGISDPVKEFLKAAKRVGAANAKLVAFERGFLHEEGIKDREWYRHLGVAPGKWLGMSGLLSSLQESI